MNDCEGRVDVRTRIRVVRPHNVDYHHREPISRAPGTLKRAGRGCPGSGLRWVASRASERAGINPAESAEVSGYRMREGASRGDD